MRAKKATKTVPKKRSEKAVAKSLSTNISRLLAQTNTPIPATKLQPVIEDAMSVGGDFANQLIDQVVEQLADQIADRLEDRLAEHVAEIRFVRRS